MKTLFEKLFPMKAQELRFRASLKELSELLQQERTVSAQLRTEKALLVAGFDAYKRRPASEHVLRQEQLVTALEEDVARLQGENEWLRKVIRVYESRNKEHLP